MPTNHSQSVSKRKRTNNSPETNQTSSKRSKTQKLTKKEMEEMKTMMTKLSAQVTQAHESLHSQIGELKSNLKGDVANINQNLNDIKDKVDIELQSFESDLKTQTNRIDCIEDDVKRITMLNQLRVLGFPPCDSAALTSAFNHIASKIGYTTTNPIDVPSIKQIPLKKKDDETTARGGPILLQFNAPHIKSKFYSLYLRNMPLKSEDFGLDPNTKVIIGENLTKCNADIFSFAKQLKKNNVIAQTYTNNGLVYIKRFKGREHEAVLIRSRLQLEKLAALNDSNTAEKSSTGMDVNEANN